MTAEPDDLITPFKALSVFSTLRSSLAMVDAFWHRSRIETSNHTDKDLGFIGVPPGREQWNVHNQSVAVIVVALLYQCLENYFDLRRIDSRLEDPSLEAFFKSVRSKRQFVDGMKTVRKGVFHVRSTKSWRSRNVRFFYEVCSERGGVSAVVSELRGLLYDFTEKVFLGKLRIWSDSTHEHIERLEREKPELIQKLESGEIEFSEFIDATLSSETDASDK